MASVLLFEVLGLVLALTFLFGLSLYLFRLSRYVRSQYVCDVCLEVFGSDSELQRHRYEHKHF